MNENKSLTTLAMTIKELKKKVRAARREVHQQYTIKEKAITIWAKALDKSYALKRKLHEKELSYAERKYGPKT
jgi:hypothetical protein